MAIAQDNLIEQLQAADKANGLPIGTLSSLMQQEVGGQTGKFLADPTTYHYQADQDGKRKSSAFGPFGILDSTAAAPGYGVSPLADKSLAEQIRFAGQYLAARAKSAGGLDKGLAGYGEGDKYAKAVLGRIPGARADEVVAANNPAPTDPSLQSPVQVAAAQPRPMPADASLPTPVAVDNSWGNFLAAQAKGAAPDPQAMAAYGQGPVQVASAAPSMPVAGAPAQVLMRAFQGWKA